MKLPNIYYFDSIEKVNPDQIDGEAILLVGAKKINEVIPAVYRDGEKIEDSYTRHYVVTNVSFIKDHQFFSNPENPSLVENTKLTMRDYQWNEIEDNLQDNKINIEGLSIIKDLEDRMQQVGFPHTQLRLELSRDGKNLTITPLCKHPLYNSLILPSTIKDIEFLLNKKLDSVKYLPLLNRIKDIEGHDEYLNLCIKNKELVKRPYSILNINLMIDIVSKIDIQAKRYQNNPESRNLYDEIEKLNEEVENLEYTSIIKSADAETARAAKKLSETIKAAADSYFDEKNLANYLAFRKQANLALEKAKPQLENHHSITQIIGNIFLAIAGAGVIYAAACAVNKLVTGNYLFFKPNAVKHFEAIGKAAKTIRPNSDLDIHWNDEWCKLPTYNQDNLIEDQAMKIVHLLYKKTGMVDYYLMQSKDKVATADIYTPSYMLAKLKKSIEDKKYKNSNDLNKLIKVIEFYTGVDYSKLDTKNISQYHANNESRNLLTNKV